MLLSAAEDGRIVGSIHTFIFMVHTQFLEEASSSLDVIATPARQPIKVHPTHVENCIELCVTQMPLKVAKILQCIMN